METKYSDKKVLCEAESTPPAHPASHYVHVFAAVRNYERQVAGLPEEEETDLRRCKLEDGTSLSLLWLLLLLLLLLSLEFQDFLALAWPSVLQVVLVMRSLCSCILPWIVHMSLRAVCMLVLCADFDTLFRGTSRQLLVWWLCH